MPKVVKKNQNMKEEKSLMQKAKTVTRGRVTSAKQPQTVTVIVESVKTHPLYGKTFRRTKKYLVHDTLGVSEGDLVEIVQIKPMSANKHFQILRVVGKDIEAIVTEQLKEEAKEAIAEVMPESEESEDQKISESEDQSVGISEKSEEKIEEKEEKSEKKTKRGKK